MNTNRQPPSDHECLEICAMWNQTKSIKAIIGRFNRSATTVKSILRRLNVPVDEYLERLARANYEARLANKEAAEAKGDGRPKAERLFERAWAEHHAGKRYEDNPAAAFSSRCAQPIMRHPAPRECTLGGVVHYGER